MGGDVWMTCTCVIGSKTFLGIYQRGGATTHAALYLSESDLLWQSKTRAKHPLLRRYVSYVVDVDV
jgi:hypothetical protein